VLFVVQFLYSGGFGINCFLVFTSLVTFFDQKFYIYYNSACLSVLMFLYPLSLAIILGYSQWLILNNVIQIYFKVLFV